MRKLIELLKCESWDLYHEELIILIEGRSCSQLLESDLLVGVAVPIRNALLCLEAFPTGHPTKRREALDILQQFWSLEELQTVLFHSKVQMDTCVESTDLPVVSIYKLPTSKHMTLL